MYSADDSQSSTLGSSPSGPSSVEPSTNSPAPLPESAEAEKPRPQKESHLRSLLKGLSWRVVATTDTILIAYFITGETAMAISIGGIEVVTKIVIYYFHERAWQYAPIGTVRRVFSRKNPR